MDPPSRTTISTDHLAPDAPQPPNGGPHQHAGASEEEPSVGATRQLGCSKCRYSKGGCARCRNPSFRPRRSSIPQEELAAVAAQQRRAARLAQAAAAEGGRPAKRRRGAATAQQAPHAPAPGNEEGVESLVSQLRRRLEQGSQASGAQQAQRPQQPSSSQQTSGASSAADGLAERLEAMHTWGGEREQGGGASEAPLAAAQPAAGQSAPAAPVPLGEPPPSRKRGPHQARGAGSDAESEGAAGGGAPQSMQRPAKQRRVGASGAPLPVVAQRGKRGRSPGAEKLAAEERLLPPRRFRKVLSAQQPPLHQQQQQHQPQQGQQQPQQEQQQQQQQQDELMDVDAQEPDLGTAGASPSLAATGAAGGGPSSTPAGAGMPGVPAGTGSIPADGTPAGSKRSFLCLLEENMERRRAERQQQPGGGAPLPQLLLPPRAAKRQRKEQQLSPQAASPPASAGRAPVAAEPDPRLCLWEPPVSPFGLLEEELFDDPWKVLVACMLLNKTTAQQVRKVIWDLFQLCPTPQAAVAADVSAIESLITPLGLFRKRAVAVQRLSHDYIHKQWRDPSELFGIGQYAADAYQIFCRGRWREVQPTDKDLRRYLEWLEGTGGLGSGLSRHRTMAAGPAAAAAAAGPVPAAPELTAAAAANEAAALETAAADEAAAEVVAPAAAQPEEAQSTASV